MSLLKDRSLNLTKALAELFLIRAFWEEKLIFHDFLFTRKDFPTRASRDNFYACFWLDEKILFLRSFLNSTIDRQGSFKQLSTKTTKITLECKTWEEKKLKEIIKKMLYLLNEKGFEWFMKISGSVRWLGHKKMFALGLTKRRHVKDDDKKLIDSELQVELERSWIQYDGIYVQSPSPTLDICTMKVEKFH